MNSSSLLKFFSVITFPFLKLLDWLTPLADLIARCWVGYVFLKSGLLKLDSWQSTLMLFTYEFHVPLLPPTVAAVLGTTMEVTLPILVILGLGSRLAIAALFIFNLFAAISYPALWTPDGLPGLLQHANWGAILLLLMCHGSGKISLDNVIRYFHQKNSSKINQA